MQIFFRRNLIISVFFLFFSIVLYSLIEDKRDYFSLIAGFFIFFVPDYYFRYRFKRNNNKKLSAPYVIYEVAYAVVMKFMILLLLLFFSFKYLMLNDRIVIITFIFLIFIKLIISTFFKINGKFFQ